MFIIEGASGRVIDLEGVQEPQSTLSRTEEPVDRPIVPQPNRKSGRVPKIPGRYGFIIEDDDEVRIIEDDDPVIYDEAMSRRHSEKWQMAMKSEMDSMYENQV